MPAVDRDDRAQRSLLDNLRRLAQYRELLLTLAARDLKIRYKQSVLGVAWAVIQPFALMVVFSIVFAFFVHVKTAGAPYPVFSYVALVPWTYFSVTLNIGVASVVGNASLVSKLYFPREIFPLACLLSGLVDFLVAATILAGLLLYYHIGPTPQLLWLPAIILLQLALMAGLLLVLSAANVFYRDIRLLVPFVLQIGLYMTPVIYPLTSIPSRYRLLVALNPMTGIVDAYRRVIVQGQPPDPRLLTLTAAIALVLLIVGYRFFKNVEMQFADVI